jgi:hypothetical protein
MNKVVQLLEVGPNDGKEMAVPKDAVQVEMTQLMGDSHFRVVYADTGRRTRLGFPVFERIECILVEAK